MKSILIPILAAGLIATAPAAPARADAQNIAGVLAGVVTLGLIAKAINDRNEERDKARAAEVTRNAPNRQDTWRPLGRHPGHNDRVLPSACLVEVTSVGPGAVAYDRQCLRERVARAERLPASCEWKTRTDRGWRTVYGAECLSRAGYRTEDRWARY